MEMSNHEILRDFQSAKNKHEQIKILADLNVCKPDDIVEILKMEGVDRRLLPKPYRGQTTEPQTHTIRASAPQLIKPRALHDWDRMVALADAVRAAIAAGETPENVWIHEMSDTLIRYYPSNTKEGESKK